MFPPQVDHDAFRTLVYPLIQWARASGIALLLWPMVAAAAVFLWTVCDEYFVERRQILGAMRRFGEQFVHEFERPLVQSPAEGRPIQARLRASPDRRRLEILIAPAAPHRYPNLADHRRNVAYDVARVVQQLGDRSFVCAAPFAQGAWVVVPFQFQGRTHQAGGS